VAIPSRFDQRNGNSDRLQPYDCCTAAWHPHLLVTNAGHADEELSAEIAKTGEGGIRTLSRIPRKNALSQQGSAESGAVCPASLPIDLDLASLINGWPTLPEPIKAEILAMIRASIG
jgi:hypothetical protein